MEDNQLIFCIGYNKSGTTSLYKAITDLGFEGYHEDMMGNAEYLLRGVMIEELVHRRYSKHLNVVYDWVEECKIKTQKASDDQNFIKHMNVFKDVPFSLPGVWKKLYERYPNAKYILTERDSADQWFNSITRFHQIGFGYKQDKKSVITWKDLTKSKYRYHSYVHDCMLFLNTYGLVKTKSKLPYDSQLKDSYNLHNSEVKDFFKNKDNFLSINVANDLDYLKLCSFLDKEPPSPPIRKRRSKRHGVDVSLNKFPRLKITKDPSTWDNL